jgi:hypothetical protein
MIWLLLAVRDLFQTSLHGNSTPFASAERTRSPLRRRYPGAILVPAGKGSTSIDMWVKGNELRLYDKAIKAMQIAVSQGAVLAGIMWEQGEYEAQALAAGFTSIGNYHNSEKGAMDLTRSRRRFAYAAWLALARRSNSARLI